MTDEIWLETDHPYFNKDLDCVWGDYVSIGITNTNGFSVEYLLNRTSAQNGEKLSVIVHRYNNNITHSGPHDGGKIAWYVAGCRCWDCRQAYFNRISTDKTLDEARIEV